MRERVENPTEKARPAFDACFRFAIGEVVCKTASLRASRQDVEIGGSRWPPGIPLLTVVGRRLDECHGGVQAFYIVHGYHDLKGGGPENVLVAEYLLESYDQAVTFMRKVAAVRDAEHDAKRETD